MSVLFSNRVYIFSFFVLIISLLVTFVHRAEYFDEAWFAEQSYWFVREGRVRSELFRGYNGWETGLYVFHKLFIYAGAAVMQFTGFTVAGNKVVSILFGLIGAGLVWGYGQRLTREQQWLGVLLYVGCGTLIRFMSVNRPETMCMALGFASYLALDKPGLPQPRSALAGFLAGLSALTHLNGLMYLAAGSLWLVWRKDWRSCLLFSVVGGLTLSLYGADALLDGRFSTLVDQFVHDPATQQNFKLTDKLWVMLDFHQTFFHSQNEAALTVLVLVCGLFFRKRIDWQNGLFRYTLLLIGSFWLLTKSVTDIYFLLFLPWLAVLAAQWLITYLPRQPRWQRQTMRVLLVGYWVVAAVQIREVLIENRDSLDVEAHNALLASYMPLRQSKVIAPLEFFFGQMDQYRIQGLTLYFLQESAGHRLSLATFFRQAQQQQVRYIISDHRLNTSYDIPPSAPAQIGHYRRIFQDKWNSLYQLETEPAATPQPNTD